MGGERVGKRAMASSICKQSPRHRATNGESGLLEMALVAPVVGLEAWLPYLRHLKMQLHGFGFRAVACVPIFNSRVSCICA